MGYFGYQPEEGDDGIPSAELIDIVRRSLRAPNAPNGENIVSFPSNPWPNFQQPNLSAFNIIDRGGSIGSVDEADHRDVQSIEPVESAPFQIAMASPEGIALSDQGGGQIQVSADPANSGLAPVSNLRGFPPEVIAGAQTTQQRTGIPASVTLAQWALESGWGKKMPPGSNNPFGIKAVGDQPFVTTKTREENSRGQSYYTSAKFRKFDSLQQALDAHAQVLMSDRFASARAALPNVDGFLDKLTRAYGMDHNYGKVLRNIVHGRHLEKLDQFSEEKK